MWSGEITWVMKRNPETSTVSFLFFLNNKSFKDQCLRNNKYEGKRKMFQMKLVCNLREDNLCLWVFQVIPISHSYEQLSMIKPPLLRLVNSNIKKGKRMSLPEHIWKKMEYKSDYSHPQNTDNIGDKGLLQKRITTWLSSITAHPPLGCNCIGAFSIKSTTDVSQEESNSLLTSFFLLLSKLLQVTQNNICSGGIHIHGYIVARRLLAPADGFAVFGEVVHPLQASWNEACLLLQQRTSLGELCSTEAKLKTFFFTLGWTQHRREWKHNSG